MSNIVNIYTYIIPVQYIYIIHITNYNLCYMLYVPLKTVVISWIWSWEFQNLLIPGTRPAANVDAAPYGWGTADRHHHVESQEYGCGSSMKLFWRSDYTTTTTVMFLDLPFHPRILRDVKQAAVDRSDLVVKRLKVIETYLNLSFVVWHLPREMDQKCDPQVGQFSLLLRHLQQA